MAITKEICIEKICTIPIDFKLGGKSSFALATESNFAYLYSEISPQDIKNYLSIHKTLLREWEIWTEDKRTRGYGLSISNGEYSIGYRDSTNNLIFYKTFTSALDACAEYIFREVASILKVEIQENRFDNTNRQS